jgi:hypothetical protein
MRFGPGGGRRALVLAVASAVALLVAAGCSDDSGDEVPPQSSRTPEPAIGTGPPVADVSMATVTVAPGGEVTVDLVVTPQAGMTVGALDVDVTYDNTVLRATACDPEGCNPAFTPDTIHFSMASLDGFNGPSGSATFTAIGAAGAVSPLRVRLTTCANVEAEILSCSGTDGSVTIAAQ